MDIGNLEVLQHVGYQYLKLDDAQRTIHLRGEEWRSTWVALPKRVMRGSNCRNPERAKIECGFVRWRQHLYALGTPPDRSGWEVKLRDPLISPRP
jgi:hypothetical protein